MKARVSRPAVISVIGAPFRQSGTSASLRFSLMPAMMQIAIVKPMPAPKLSTTASRKLSISQRFMKRHSPSIAQLVVIRGRKIPKLS